MSLNCVCGSIISVGTKTLLYVQFNNAVLNFTEFLNVHLLNCQSMGQGQMTSNYKHFYD